MTKTKTLFAAALLSAASVGTVGAALVTPENFTVAYATGSGFAGGNNSFQLADGTKKASAVAWTAANPNAVSDYVSATSLAGTAAWGNSSQNSSANMFYRNQFGAPLPTTAGSNTWFITNMNQAVHTARSTTSLDSDIFSSFTIKNESTDATMSLTNLSYNWYGANSDANTIAFVSNVYYSVGGAEFKRLYKDDFGSGAVAYSTNGGTGLLTGGGEISLALDVGQSATFRIVLDSSLKSNSNAVGFKNVLVSGTMTPVPEPSTYALFGGIAAAGIALAVRRRRKG